MKIIPKTDVTSLGSFKMLPVVLDFTDGVAVPLAGYDIAEMLEWDKVFNVTITGSTGTADPVGSTNGVNDSVYWDSSQPSANGRGRLMICDYSGSARIAAYTDSGSTKAIRKLTATIWGI